MGAGANTEVDVGIGQTEVAQKGGGHIIVVVLAGVHEQRLAPIGILQNVVEGGDLHKVGPCCGNQVNDGQVFTHRS